MPPADTMAKTRASATASHGADADGRIVNALTVDVEDYFQVQAFAGTIARTDWETLPRRVERNTNRLLDLFGEAGSRATFFTLGWVAERHPGLVRRMVAEGHEVASHGWDHQRADGQSAEIFRADVTRTKKLLEDLAGTAVRGYRAATFSIGPGNRWAYDELAAAGYGYSSSVYPIAHDLYGDPNGARVPYRAGASGLTEIPLTTMRLFGRNFPCAGGGYFRLLPYGLSRWAMRRVNAERLPCIFYMHPWEIDPDQPRQQAAPLKSRLRHYTGLAAMEGRLARLLRDFRWDRMDRAFADAIRS